MYRHTVIHSYELFHMIRIAFLIRSLGYGGAERQLTTLVKALDKNCFDVTVITFYPGGPFEKELGDSNVRLICLGKRGRWDVIPFLWRLVGELRRLRPEILHSYLVEPNVIAVLLKPLFRSHERRLGRTGVKHGAKALRPVRTADLPTPTPGFSVRGFDHRQFRGWTRVPPDARISSSEMCRHSQRGGPRTI